MNETSHPHEVFARTPLTGPAYAPVFKATATLLIIAIAYYTFRLIMREDLVLSLEAKAGIVLVAVSLFASYWALMRSTLTINGKGLTQTMMFKRPVDWVDIRSVRLVRLPTTARLFVRASGRRMAVFHAGNEELAIAFALIARRYPPH